MNMEGGQDLSDGVKIKKRRKDKTHKAIPLKEKETDSSLNENKKPRNEDSSDLKEAVTDSSLSLNTTPAPSAQGARRKRTRNEEDDAAGTRNKAGEITSKKKRKKGGRCLDLDSDSVPNVSVADPETVEETQKKKKKKTIERAKAPPSDPEQSRADARQKSTTKKKKKNRQAELENSLPNPQDDSSLNEKARNALTYAYSRLTTQSQWKFNKALQNWIVKNAWSDETIPDAYMVLIVGYLSNCQGSARTNLIQTCESILSAATSPSPSVPRQASANPQVCSERARTLLNVLASEQVNQCLDA